MMLLSRFWYVFLGLLAGVAAYVVFLAVGQYNRSNYGAMKELLASDLRVVRKELQLDARRRLDVLLPAAVDKGIQEALVSANGKPNLGSRAKEDGRKAVEAARNSIQADLRPDILFAVDREGRVVGQVGYEASNAYDHFELGGYPAVFDAIHGYLRDDTWVWDKQLYRVNARPVEYDVNQPPVGAIVALKTVDNAFAKKIATSTRSNVAFFTQRGRAGAAAGVENFDELKIDQLNEFGAKLEADKEFLEKGISSFYGLGEKEGVGDGAIFSRLEGDAWLLRANVSVIRTPSSIEGPMQFISGADETDKKSVNWILLGGIVAGALILGLLFSHLEHTLPLRTMKKEADRLKKGEVDLLPLSSFRATYRLIAQDLNAGIERVAEKGGGAPRKQADLEAILGPVPVKPAMSAFSLPGSADPEPSVSTLAQPSGPKASLPKPPPSLPNPSLGNPLMPNPPSMPKPSGPSAFASDISRPTPVAEVPASSRIAASSASRPVIPPMASSSSPLIVGSEEEAVLLASTAKDTETIEWVAVYEDFVKTKKQCGEAIEGLTFEKFQHTLKKNRDALIQRHGCKRVKFSVYVKDGKASLKATPVKE
ncbi:MAG: hypothetical protein KBF88_04670 [Polyangiaceae bacterium]|nr:hypothetical protein [Polyangiaceae bacterium]